MDIRTFAPLLGTRKCVGYTSRWTMVFIPSNSILGAKLDQSHSQQRLGDDDAVRVQLTFLEFTTGSLHPLSSTHTVSFPPLYGHFPTFLGADFLGDHILVLLWSPRNRIAFYLVSWKAGIVVLVNRLEPNHATTLQPGDFKALVIDENVFVLMKDSRKCLEVCKLEITPLGPCLQSICFLELPPLMPIVAVDFSWTFAEWVPTSNNYAPSRSSRASHPHFYSSPVGTIGLFLDYRVSWDRDPYKYALIISVAALLYAIRTGMRNVPWVEWGPSSTHLFERTGLCPAGPVWITRLAPLVLRQYYPRRTRCTQSMPEDTSSPSRTGPQVFSSKVSGKVWVGHSIETNLPYRDVVVNGLNLGHIRHILADREWIVGTTKTEMEGSSIRITVYHLA